MASHSRLVLFTIIFNLLFCDMYFYWPFGENKPKFVLTKI